MGGGGRSPTCTRLHYYGEGFVVGVAEQVADRHVWTVARCGKRGQEW